MVGVTAQIASESGGSDGVGFAIPSDTVESIVSQLLASGQAEHAYLGVSLQTIPASVAGELNLVEGVEVAQVKGGTPAAQAGLRAATGSATVAGQSYPTGGDVITAVNGQKIMSAEQLQSTVDARRPGDTISLTYSRAGTSQTVQLKLATRP